MQQTSRGFTLIELMIVIAVIAILSALAMPSYVDYRVRARVAEGLALAGPAKLAVVRTYSETGVIPDQAATDYESATSDHVQGISIENNGSVRIVMQNIGIPVNPILELQADFATAQNVVWNCNLVAGEARHVPPSCR
ncbi:MAG: pilin [Wenzhouxiangellaceae bacterium]|nr:pilin [Wenzhouxiangellaceae bacterium]